METGNASTGGESCRKRLNGTHFQATQLGTNRGLDHIVVSAVTSTSLYWPVHAFRDFDSACVKLAVWQLCFVAAEQTETAIVHATVTYFFEIARWSGALRFPGPNFVVPVSL
ncbi:unnamed protein product [Polarella glacialis]|uniref:Uncharacterized protein n=1 Tax=Polarella glacialis TaxID=89957 RepID=A0A813EI78_POLGL|nr:unnamed protein product [Polarella glacialis]